LSIASSVNSNSGTKLPVVCARRIGVPCGSIVQLRSVRTKTGCTKSRSLRPTLSPVTSRQAGQPRDAMGDMEEENPDYKHVRGLVEPLPERVRPRRRGGRGQRWRRRLPAPWRLKEVYYREGGFPERRLYTEWRLCMGINELVERCPEGSTEDKVGERLLLFFQNFSSVCRVLWLTDTHFLLCSDRDTRRILFHFLPSYIWECNFETEWGLDELSLHSWAAEERDHNNSSSSSTTAQVLRSLHRIVALGTHIHTTRIALPRDLPAFGIEDFLSRIESRRTVWLNFPITSETGHAVAFNCSRHVALVITMSRWQDRGAALAEAMAANQCPREMQLHSLDERSIQILAGGLEATTSIDALTIVIASRIPRYYSLLFDAIGRSGGIRSLTVKERNIFFRHTDYLAPILLSTSIQRLDIRKSLILSSHRSDPRFPNQEVDRLARLIRSNRTILHLVYHPQVSESETFQARVAPVLRANRARLGIKAMIDGGGGASGPSPGRAASQILQSPLVRDHPETLFLVLQALFGLGVLPPPPPRGGNVAGF
jgi:hypothetical protein